MNSLQSATAFLEKHGHKVTAKKLNGKTWVTVGGRFLFIQEYMDAERLLGEEHYRDMLTRTLKSALASLQSREKQV